MPPRASLAYALCLLLLSAPGRASDPASTRADLRAVWNRLSPAVEDLRAGGYAQKDHAAAGAALESISELLASPKPGEKDLLELQKAAGEALQAEAPFWTGLTPECRAGRAKVPAQAGAIFRPRLEEVAALLGRMFPGTTVGGAVPTQAVRPPAELKKAQAVVDPQRWNAAVDGSQGRRFWDLDTAAGRLNAGAVSSTGGSGAASPRTSRTMKGLKLQDVPAFGESPAPQPAEDAEKDRLAAPCRQALGAHPQIAGLCREHPTLAPLIAGVVEAFKAQFGTIQGIATNLMFLVLGLVMSALSGFGLVAKVAVSLASLGMLAATLGPLFKEGWDASRALLQAGVGTLQKSQSLLRLGQVGGTVLVLALMSAIGYGVGKTKPGRAAIDSMTSALSAQMSRLGVGRGAAALDASLPASVKGPLERAFGPVPGQGELTGTPASINPAENPSNKLALQRQNDAAQLLAQNGYRVHQNGLSAGADYLIDGVGHDCYSPFTGKAANIWTTLEGKAARNQAHSFVLNLDGSSVELGALQAQALQHPIPNLGDILVVRTGTVTPLVKAGKVVPLPVAAK
ncbi:MAG: hypothetical protein NTY77_13195 [Elusimicrobia bacterium]|nr:hypothetical protein [Elusimicrobiota bacterium]